MLFGTKSPLKSKGIIGAVAVIIASAAAMFGYSEVQGEDIKAIIASGTALVAGVGLMYKRFTQAVKGLDVQAGALALISVISGIYVTLTGDNEGGSIFVTSANGVIISFGAILSAFGIDVATKKIQDK